MYNGCSVAKLGRDILFCGQGMLKRGKKKTGSIRRNIQISESYMGRRSALYRKTVNVLAHDFETGRK